MDPDNQPKDQESDEQGFYGVQKQSQNQPSPKKQEEEDNNSDEDSEPLPTKKSKKIKKARQSRAGKQKLKKEKNFKEIAIKSAAKQIAENLLKQMDRCFDKDLSRYQKKKTANKKLLFLPTLSKQLKKTAVCQQFLDKNGLTLIQKWFRKLPDGNQPSLAIRKGLLEILAFLNVRDDHLAKAQQLQKIVQKHKKSLTKQLRDLSQIILKKWTQISYYDFDE